MNDKKLSDLYTDFKKQNDTEYKFGYIEEKNSHVLLIDGLNTFFRNWSVNPTMNDHGNHMGGVVGSLRSIGYVIREFKPTRCIVVWDGKGGSQRRRKLFPEYKANRKPNKRLNRTYDELMSVDEEEQSMRYQIITLIKYLKALPITLISLDLIEADDVIAYLANDVFKERVTICSTDKDFIQLITQRINVYSPTKKIIFTPEKVYETYKIPAHNFLMYRILDGDKSDKITGIHGIGLTTLIKRLPMLGKDRSINTNEILDYAETHKGKYKVFDNILDGKDIIDRNYKLMQLKNVNISGINKIKIMDKMEEEISKMNKASFIKYLIDDNLGSTFKNFHEWIRDTFTKLNSYNG